MMKADEHFIYFVSRGIEAKEQLMGHSQTSGTLPVHQTLVFLLDSIN